MKKLLILLLNILFTVSINAQSMLCTYQGGYFIRNGNTWYEYRPKDKDGIWNTYSQYSSDKEYIYIRNKSKDISIPKRNNNSIWIYRNNKWEVLYRTINVYNYCPVKGAKLFAYKDGFFIKTNNTWQEYNPLKKQNGAFDSFIQNGIDDNYYYIKNNRISLAIPRNTSNDFFWNKDGKWVKLYTAEAVYDNSTTNTDSDKNKHASSTSSNNNIASSLTHKKWESKFDKGYTEYVRESDGMVTETMHLNCVCLNGICKICAGLGVSGYGIFQTNCISCGGTGKCSFCGGTGTKVTTYRYRFVDEYYSNGATALHVTSSNSGPSVYRGGVGYAYYTYGNSKPIKDEGSYYSFGGETVYGVKTASFRLSKDYKTLWMGNDEYHLINKEEYDRIASITSKVTSGAMPVPSGGNPVHSTSGSSSSSHRSGGSSVYTNCTSCGGTGICPRCGGKKGSWQNTGYYTGNGSESWINCSGCNGSGKCSICYGRGKL